MTQWELPEYPASEITPRPRDQFLRDQAIAGTPEQCIEQIAALAREPGTGHFCCVFNGNGVLDAETALRGTTLFAREVLPVCARVSRTESEPAERT